VSKLAEKVWEQVGLKESEYRRVCDILRREPNHVELQMFGVMWSEHCSYKHSKATLKKLPTTGEYVLQGPGENAGVIKVSEDVAIAFKIESHNHPSFIEPFQGAATGVGGIVRDVFTMGARPIALLDSLRFGPIDEPKQRHLFGGAVAGIGHYGNCIGVPTVGGEVYFEESYRGNCLVNAMCVGLVHPDKIRKGIAKGPGNLIMVVGARTGRDGIHGASLLASAEFTAGAEEKRPSVQVGDPFLEKLLLEACMELFETDAVVGIQDMGAAGLISSSSEMAARGRVGITLDIRKVPAREEGMAPWEFLLSESQERMLVCVRKGREAEVEAIFEKWGLLSAVVGTVTDDGLIRVLDGGEVVAEVPARALADEAPVYHPEKREPAYLKELHAFDSDRLPQPEDWNGTLLKLMGSPNICSRQWIYQQYDHQVLVNTIILPGGDAALLRLRNNVLSAVPRYGKPREGERKERPTAPHNLMGIAVKVDCNGRFCYLNPRRGAAIAVAEAARNVVCAGARPVAITNNLNWGNPEKPEIFWTFDQAVEGIAEACEALGTPVTGGNVSFYNETDGQAIYPTPTIGMVGIHENLLNRPCAFFRNEGDVIAVLGVTKDEMGGSEYLKVIHGTVAGDAPSLDLEAERKLQKAVLTAIHEGIVTAAHDVAEGGLAVALAEMAVNGKPGARGFQATVFVNEGEGRIDGHLFGESQSRIILTVNRDNVLRLRAICIENGVPHRLIGDVQDGTCLLAVQAPGQDSPFIFRRAELINLPTEEIAHVWREALPTWMKS
jgi:phosphoribosylformylglycinamidine synthase subunit PurL